MPKATWLSGYFYSRLRKREPLITFTLGPHQGCKGDGLEGGGAQREREMPLFILLKNATKQLITLIRLLPCPLDVQLDTLRVVHADDTIQRHRELLSDWLRDEFVAFVSCHAIGCFKIRCGEPGDGGARYQENASYWCSANPASFAIVVARTDKYRSCAKVKSVRLPLYKMQPARGDCLETVVSPVKIRLAGDDPKWNNMLVLWILHEWFRFLWHTRTQKKEREGGGRVKNERERERGRMREIGRKREREKEREREVKVKSKYFIC